MAKRKENMMFFTFQFSQIIINMLELYPALRPIHVIIQHSSPYNFHLTVLILKHVIGTYHIAILVRNKTWNEMIMLTQLFLNMTHDPNDFNSMVQLVWKLVNQREGRKYHQNLTSLAPTKIFLSKYITCVSSLQFKIHSNICCPCSLQPTKLPLILLTPPD